MVIILRNFIKQSSLYCLCWMIYKNRNILLKNKFARKDFYNICKTQFHPIDDIKCLMCSKGRKILRIKPEQSTILMCNCKKEFSIKPIKG